MWQDIVIMVGGFVLSIALVPALRSTDKPPVSTCFITGTVLAAFTISYLTLGLWLAFGATALTTAMWYWLGIQKMYYESSSRKQRSESQYRASQLDEGYLSWLEWAKNDLEWLEFAAKIMGDNADQVEAYLEVQVLDACNYRTSRGSCTIDGLTCACIVSETCPYKRRIPNEQTEVNRPDDFVERAPNSVQEVWPWWGHAG